MPSLSALPPEIHRHVIEDVGFYDLYNTVTVSRLWQVESERLLWREVDLGDRSVAQALVDCDSLLKSPKRFWPLIKRLDFEGLFFMKTVKEILPKTFYAHLHDLLVKLNNLVYFGISFLSSAAMERSWNLSCGNLFRGCDFQLRILRCNFALDGSLALFLDDQPLISDWAWTPTSPSIYPLPSRSLSRLSVFSTLDLTHVPLGGIMAGRPLTHLSITCSAPNAVTLHDISLSTAPLRALRIHYDLDMFAGRQLPTLAPHLEYFGQLNLNSTLEPALLQDVLPLLKQLRVLEVVLFSNEVGGDGSALAATLHAACPTLLRISIKARPNTVTVLHQWDDEHKNWREPRLILYDQLGMLWDEMTHLTHEPAHRFLYLQHS